MLQQIAGQRVIQLVRLWPGRQNPEEVNHMLLAQVIYLFRPYAAHKRLENRYSNSQSDRTRGQTLMRQGKDSVLNLHAAHWRRHQPFGTRSSEPSSKNWQAVLVSYNARRIFLFLVNILSFLCCSPNRNRVMRQSSTVIPHVWTHPN